MGQIYIKFKDNTVAKTSADQPRTWLTEVFETFFVKVMTAIIPKANPDFEEKIDDVDQWLIEINEVTGDPEREIGINSLGQTILIAPFNRNHGYWTDNTLRLDDFIEIFNAIRIEDKAFNYRWDRFENGHSD